MNCSYKTYSYLYSPTTYTERHIPSSSTNSTLRYASFLLYHTTTHSWLLFNNNCSSHLLNVLVITISLIFKSLVTWNLVSVLVLLMVNCLVLYLDYYRRMILLHTNVHTPNYCFGHVRMLVCIVCSLNYMWYNDVCT